MTSACYVYAIVPRDAPPPAGACADGAELTLVPCRELAALTGRMGEDGAAVSAQAVLRHEAVVEAARRQGPALPVRFGTVFRDAEAVACALAERYETLVADLDRLGDRVELCLTALWAAPPGDEGSADAPRVGGARSGGGAGARYLYARAAELQREQALKQRARAVARELDQRLGGLARERRVSLLPTPRVAVRTAYLLDAAAVAAFRATFQATRRARGDLRLLLTGPWPPYSFVTPPEAGSGAAPTPRLVQLAQLLTDAMGRPG